MGILVDDDFQSYSLGQTQPYGQLVKGNALNSEIVATNPTLFGDAKGVAIPSLARSLIYPTDTPHNLFTPFYGSGTATFGLNIDGSTIDTNGTIFQFVSGGDNPSTWLVPLMTLRVLADGTLAFTTDNTLNIFAVSDYALLTGQWYWIQVNASFSTDGTEITYTANVIVNGITVLSVVNQHTFIHSSDVNGYVTWNCAALGGAGIGTWIGRFTLYDSQQPDNTYAHAGSPVAEVSSMVIELIRPAVASSVTGTCPVGGGTANVGSPYGPFTIGASGGVAPYTFAVTGGALPPGITLSSSGVLSGTPTGLGTYNYTVTITDSNGATGTVSCTIVVSNVVPTPPPFCIAPPSPTFESTLVTYTEPTELEGS